MPSPRTFTKIADHFRERILSGELEPGAKLPTNREIAGQWQAAACHRLPGPAGPPGGELHPHHAPGHLRRR
nr:MULTISPECIES: GntR family transcriptional regulator [Streptomyces]